VAVECGGQTHLTQVCSKGALPEVSRFLVGPAKNQTGALPSASQRSQLRANWDRRSHVSSSSRGWLHCVCPSATFRAAMAASVAFQRSPAFGERFTRRHARRKPKRKQVLNLTGACRGIALTSHWFRNRDEMTKTAKRGKLRIRDSIQAAKRSSWWISWSAQLRQFSAWRHSAVVLVARAQ